MLQTKPQATQQSNKTDAQIQSEVFDELKWDTRVKPEHIGIEVREGMVALTGHVDSYAELSAAQEAAHRVSGVSDVATQTLRFLWLRIAARIKP